MSLFERLEIPACERTRMPVKALVTQLEADGKTKRLLESHIASMYLVSLLNDQTIRVRGYQDDDHSFRVIYIYEIVLKANDRMTELMDLLHSAFAESTLFLMQHKKQEYLSCACKRINKNDRTKSVIEDLVWTEVPEDAPISLRTISVADLKEYYEWIVHLVYRVKVMHVAGVFPADGYDYKDMIKEYESLSAGINRLREEYAGATMRNEKMRIDEEMYQTEQKLKRLVETIGGSAQ